MHSKKSRNDSSKKFTRIGVLLFTWMVVIVWRLGWLQVVKYDHYLSRAENNQLREMVITPSRGSIVDRNGRELAYTVMTESVFADQRALRDEKVRRKTAQLLAPMLGIKENELLGLLTGSSGFKWLKRKLPPEPAELIRKIISQHKLTGIAFKKEPQRFYPNNTLASHLIGYIGAEERGLGGLEQSQDIHLKGKPGEMLLTRDGAGHAYERRDIPASPGSQLISTIDSVLQHKVEMLLDEALRTTRAKGAGAVVLDPKTGEILALANAPAFDPNERAQGEDTELRHNRVISYPYEPGSVFKIFTYAAGMELGILNPDENVDCLNGKISIGKRVITDLHPHGVIKYSEAFAVSSNIAAIKLAQQIGRERFFEYIYKFGFGSKTGIELPGESRGIVNPLSSWRPDSIGSVAIGQEISVTVLQAASAVAAIANKGVRVKPHLVKRIVDHAGNTLYAARPESQVIVSEDTALRMTELLKLVTTEGTARNAIKLNGYTAAGKTGTPQKIDPETRAYSQTKYMPSFAGFVPSADPRFVIVVMIDEPVGVHQGGSVAAPVFNLIAEAALSDYSVPHDDKNYKERLAALSKKYEAERSSDLPSPIIAEKNNSAKKSVDKKPEEKNVVKIKQPNMTTIINAKGRGIVMPDLKGQGLRAVLSACSKLDMKARLIGSGKAVRQSPSPGTIIKHGDECKVEFK